LDSLRVSLDHRFAASSSGIVAPLPFGWGDATTVAICEAVLCVTEISGRIQR